jgi:hypothetical protein
MGERAMEENNNEREMLVQKILHLHNEINRVRILTDKLSEKNKDLKEQRRHLLQQIMNINAEISLIKGA